MTPETGRAVPWSRGQKVGLAAILGLGVLIRVLLLPTQGVRGDLDQFVLWVHGIAVNGLPRAYDQNLSFPPVMAFIWGVLAAVQPAFQTVTDASDPGIRALMKTPASIADLGIALVCVYALRDRPRWALVAAAGIALHPAVIDVSAWWGQYESIYLLSAMAAVVFAIRGRLGLAAALLAISIMTKPQALPFLIPFAAWFWAQGGIRGFARAAIVGAVVVLVLWLPFIAADGPRNYLHNLAIYQGEILNILSLRAWNMWWLVQSVVAGGSFVADDVAFLGPVSLRLVGYAITAVLALVVALAILRDPKPRTLILGLAATTLIAFSFLTSMHERYAFGVVGFLMLLVPDRTVRALAIAFAIVFTANLLAAAPPTPQIAALLPIDGWLGIAGSVTILALTVAMMRLTGVGQPPRSEAPDPASGPAPAMP